MESETAENSVFNVGPSVDSDDPNERKLARRTRIERRLEAARIEKLKAEGNYVEPESEKPLIDETIETCEDTLRRLYSEGKHLVTNVRIAGDFKEVERRENEARERNLRLDKLKEESSAALAKLDEISEKWEAILDTSGPLELFQHMKEQKAKCLELIKQKNDLIKSFQMELKVADEKFMKDRKAMYDDIALITKRIDEQVLLMKRAYRVELQNVQESVDTMRSQIMEKHSKIWTSLYSQRKKTEVNNMERKFKMVKDLLEEQHQINIDHEEKFRETKIQLETDIQMLEQELEQVKALCLLNSEKLDYNYQVLKKREEENVYIKNDQKRRLNKLQDMVNTLKKKIDEKRNSTDDEIKRLTREVERYHANLVGMESKMYHFAYVNQKKFHNIWKMKQEEANDLVNKILSADMVIHEQVLGFPWTAPSFTPGDLTGIASFKVDEFGSESVGSSTVLNDGSKSSITKSLRSEKSGESVKPEAVDVHKFIMRQILEAIADQSGFLMEEKLDDLLKPYTENEKTFVRLDNVFVAIGIKTERDIETMAKMFEPYTVCLVCEKQRASIQSIEDSGSKLGDGTKQASILQIRELEEKVSKLRIARGNVFSFDEPIAKEEKDIQEQNVDKVSINGSETFVPEGNWANSISQKRELFKRQTEVPSPTKSLKSCALSHPLVIEKYHVLQALQDFVTSDRNVRNVVDKDPDMEKRRYTYTKLVTDEDISAYWQKYKDMLPPDVETVWNNVFLALNKYLPILQERHALNMKAKAIRRQNLDMKRLLSYYKIRKVNRMDLLLPIIPSVPTEPIDNEELSKISNKLIL